MKRYLIIFNPVAGKTKNYKWIDILEEKIKKNNDYVKIIETEHINHARTVAKEESGKYNVIVAAGGDGTLNEVVSGIIDSGEKTAMGILPIGSGNDYYRILNRPDNLEEAIEMILNGSCKTVDVGKGEDGKYLLNIASIGLDCLTVKTAQKLKKRIGGSLAYFIALLYSLLKFKKQNFKIYIDEKEIVSNSVLFCFGKGRTYGGGIGMMPWSKKSDGLFHIVNIVDIKKVFLLILAPSIIFGLHTKFKKYVKVYTAKKIRVESEDKFDFNLDGEIIEGKRSIEYTCIPNAINILTK